ncbi:MAG: hypothetical protein AUJ52_03825 [Elusimicrobia bacterium CG1_02_63_36]|nr:MAG: hypothetical protein AUJ52_03825 [Elusimicrobia bacterium CG1_02_63_36]PIP84619.1 MAG: hypothetical protein COR54_03200 [Elusimicrobia bacterium CG22_combo_CG10-13_8_21_14_all_63_91]PJA15888.1 MAG: hypothetical protein COX66_08860 [Elusimicrobia bacterium CG_4_10_14_0_2_um_filter_63_34]PJB22927.1 MAG: hypothetical protein CO113_19935 [Elusimicrobia bacterium CG_4_9_14_3_um_filter_62_55]
MGKDRDWLEKPSWEGFSSAAERQPVPAEAFNPPSAARASACALSALVRALTEGAAASGVLPEELVVLTSLRRSPDPFDALRCYRVRGLGGRALPFAEGVAAARRSTRIVCVLSAARGATLGWIREAARSGLDACLLVVNGGGCSGGASTEPDAGLAQETLRAGAGFVARLSPFDENSSALLGRALRHRGLSVVDAISICPAHDDAASFEPVDAPPGGVFSDAPQTKVMRRSDPAEDRMRQFEHERLWSALR